VKNCSRCGELLPEDAFYFVSKKQGTRRGQCKKCMCEIKSAQKDPDWLPTCGRCGETRPRSGPGRRLCQPCYDVLYDAEDVRENGAHRLKLNPCRACGAKRLRADHVKNTALCPVCRSVPQSRRKRLKAYFNMTPRQYVALLEAQRNACAICERPFTRQRVAHVDHRHAAPPIIRGATCGPCNTILGLAKDNAGRLRAAAAYLHAPPAQELFPGLAATAEGNRDSWETFRPLRRAA
jgi:hypothetical protein